MLTAVKKKLFTVDDYYAMARAGIIGEDDRVELIEGEIVLMAAIGSRHQAVVDRVTRLFVTRVGRPRDRPGSGAVAAGATSPSHSRTCNC